MAIDDATVVFLDANVLAKPITRTFLMVGSVPSGFQPVWSLAAEEEATRHMRPRALKPALVRERFGLRLAPTGADADRFRNTKGEDRQILADAAAAGAWFLITEDVDDYGLDDLISAGVSAVNPDLFLAERLTRSAYTTVIELLVERQVDPPTTPARFHAAIAKRHPRLFAVHADLFDIAPERSPHREAAVVFRGARCLRSERIVDDPSKLIDGVSREYI